MLTSRKTRLYKQETVTNSECQGKQTPDRQHSVRCMLISNYVRFTARHSHQRNLSEHRYSAIGNLNTLKHSSGNNRTKTEHLLKVLRKGNSKFDCLVRLGDVVHKGYQAFSFKGRDTRCDKSLRHIAATSRLVCTDTATRLLALLRQGCLRSVAATDRSDSNFHMSHEAICYSNLSRRRVAAICRIVCLGLFF